MEFDDQIAAVDDKPPAEKPSGPAQLVNQFHRSAFSLKAGPATILTAVVKVRREGQLIGFKEAGARLFTLSRSDGWDTVRQTVRVAGIGLLDGDSLVIKATVSGSDLEVVGVQTECDSSAVISVPGDWMIRVEGAPATFKTKADGNVSITSEAPEVVFAYFPRTSERA